MDVQEETAVSNGNKISLDAGLRIEELPASMLWEYVVDVRSPVGNDSTHIHSHVEQPHSADYVPPKIEAFSQRAQLFGFEDTVIDIIIKAGVPTCVT